MFVLWKRTHTFIELELYSILPVRSLYENVLAIKMLHKVTSTPVI